MFSTCCKLLAKNQELIVYQRKRFWNLVYSTALVLCQNWLQKEQSCRFLNSMASQRKPFSWCKWQVTYQDTSASNKSDLKVNSRDLGTTNTYPEKHCNLNSLWYRLTSAVSLHIQRKDTKFKRMDLEHTKDNAILMGNAMVKAHGNLKNARIPASNT